MPKLTQASLQSVIRNMKTETPQRRGYLLDRIQKAINSGQMDSEIEFTKIYSPIIASSSQKYADSDYSNLEITTYDDNDGNIHLRLSYAFIPFKKSSIKEVHKEIIDYTYELGIESLVNDIAVNHLQWRFDNQA